MAKTLSIFNNKGGVGKTTYMYHIAHLLARRGRKVLMVDCDSQCNLTSYSISIEETEEAWSSGGNSIYRIIEPVYEGIGDFNQCLPLELETNLYLTPGDLNLSLFEDRLGDTWNSAKGGSRPDLRIQTVIYRYIDWCINELSLDLVLIDLGPNLGALNRAVLGGSDYFIIPIAADLFSLRGTNNLGNKLVIWAEEWEQIRQSNEGSGVLMPTGKPFFLGYVVQQHNIRNNAEGMTRGWQIFGNQMNDIVSQNIVERLQPIEQVIERVDYNLGQIPNLHSLIPYSLNALKPVFDCTHKDGLNGAHITTARESVNHFTEIVQTIDHVL